MKYFPLVLAGLWRKPTRTIFTFLSIAVAFILYGILAGIDSGFAHQLEIARLDRLYVTPRFGGLMPLSYRDKIANVPGIIVVAPRAGLYGYYRDPKTPVSAVMVDESFFGARPELGVSKQQIETWSHTRAGAIIGVARARARGWKVGDKIAITTNTPAQSGSRVWTFEILSIIEDNDNPGDAQYFVGNYKYLDEARVANKGTADLFLIRVKDPNRAAAIGRAVDNLFANSPAPTRTITEKSGAQSGLQALGDVGFLTHAIVGAVLFMLLFLTGNTMMQSVRERVPEFAVLKTLGFSDSGVLALVLAEAVMLCTIAGTVGLAVAKLAFPFLKRMPNVGGILLLPWSALLTGFCIALAMAFASGLFPALRVRRLNVVDALAGR